MSIQHIVLFDGNQRNHLLPLTATRAVADIRIGILTIKEKWEKYLKIKTDVLTQDYLQPKYSFNQNENTVFINANVLPTNKLVEEIKSLKSETALMINETTIAFQTNKQINYINDFATAFNKLRFQIDTISNIQNGRRYRVDASYRLRIGSE